MDKFLRPERFAVDPSSPSAGKEWRHWHTTFTHFMDAIQGQNPDELKTLINFVSHSVYEYIADCTTYPEAISTLKALYEKKTNEVYARHLLATRRQQPSENVDQYLLFLRLLAKDGGFQAVSAEEHCQQSIRDAFIAGLLSPPIRQRLLENTTLDLQSAYSQARAFESAQKDAETFTHPIPVHSTMTNPNSTHPPLHSSSMFEPIDSVSAHVKFSSCNYCGGRRHVRSLCPAKDAECHNCSKKGHFAKVCRSENMPKSAKKITATTQATIATVSGGSQQLLAKALVPVTIGNHQLTALADSGSSESFVSERIVAKLSLEISPCDASITMASTSFSSPVLGKCSVTILLLGATYENVRLCILKNLCCDILLGQDFMRRHESIAITFGGPLPPLTICNLVAMKLNPPSLFANLSPSCRPIAIPSRRHTTAEADFIKDEVKSLLKEDIIESSDSPWRAQVLITSSERHKKRMVIDYSQTINRFTSPNAYPLPRIDDLVSKVSNYKIFSTLDLKDAYHQMEILQEDKPYTAFEASGKLYQFKRLPFGLTNAVSCFQRAMNDLIEANSLEGVFAYLDDVIVCGSDESHHDQNLQLLLDTFKRHNITLNEGKCHIKQRSINFLGYTISDGTLKPDAERLQPLRDFPIPTDSASLRRCIGLFSYYSKWIHGYSDKIRPLASCESFPLSPEAIDAFGKLKDSIQKAATHAIDESLPFVVETDASDVALAATLSQDGRPVAFFSRTLSLTEQRHSAIEKEAAAIVEAIRKWRHYLSGRHFLLITDQQSVAFMFNSRNNGKIKNDKIMRWRTELSCYSYDISYRPGKKNLSADAFSRICGASSLSSLTVSDLHNSLCHPGIRRLLHFIRSKNLPFSTEDVRKACGECKICAELKPRFYRPKTSVPLIKATRPWERVSLDFVGPKPTESINKYLLTIVDEYSRFTFAYPCASLTADTVIRCLIHLFSLCGLPEFVHSDRGSQFMSAELRDFLSARGVAQSRTTPYNPQGNGQSEKFNGTIWKAVQLALSQQNLPESRWENVLSEALHATRSLLCTATNCTPHERFFAFNRKSSNGSSLPNWLLHPGPVLLRRHIRNLKSDPLVDEVELLESNPSYAHPE